MEYNYPKFTPEMKKTHTILIPNMAITQFRLLEYALRYDGYKCEILGNCGSAVAQLGLKYVHNDTCYPALLVIGQFLDALNSGKYDLDHTALLITQTGGGCRASNYIHLLRKALVKAGYPEIPVELETPDAFIVIPMDSMLIQQVLMNLLENAVFHAKGMKNLWLRVEVKGLWAYFYVEDDGCGIPEEKLPKLFTGMLGSEAPTDQSRSSMGIGLSVCRAIVRAHGGEIYARNKIDGGAEFRFWLPAEEESNT